MQKQLSDRLEIAKSNVASWLARGQVPGNVIVQCSLDTGADVNWLVNGEIEKASYKSNLPNLSGRAVYDEVMANGGRPVLRRILDAYGFTLQKQLCELLNISSGTVSTWIRRNYFPGDIVVSCALDIGVSIKWLATGKGNKREVTTANDLKDRISRKILQDGLLKDSGEWISDLSFLTKQVVSPTLVTSSFGAWIIDSEVTNISNGRWVLGIDDKNDVYDVSLLPGEKS